MDGWHEPVNPSEADTRLRTRSRSSKVAQLEHIPLGSAIWVRAPPEALSGALEVLAIVGYEQPVTHADIRAIRGVDSGGPVETLIARRLAMEDPRFGGGGRPSFLRRFLRRFGLGSLSDCHRDRARIATMSRLSRPRLFPQNGFKGDNWHAEWTGGHGC